MPGIIRFPAYRRFDTSRIATNDAMMALLIGTRLGTHMLQEVPDSEASHLLPDLFPDLAEVQRLNRTVVDARGLIGQAERHLTYMSIPFVLTVYETFVTDVIRLVREAGIDHRTRDPSQLKLSELHPYLVNKIGLPLPGTEVALFDFIRQLRNRIVHFAGVQGSGLAGTYAGLNRDSKELWLHLAGAPPPFGASDQPLSLSARQLIPALAVTKYLADEINTALAGLLPREQWARILVSDFRERYPIQFRDRDRLLKRLTGYARYEYGAADLRFEDVELALASLQT